MCYWGQSEVISFIKGQSVASARAFTYHPVLVLLGGVVNGRVPGVGAAGVDFADVEHPVPAIGEGNSRSDPENV